MLRPLSEAAGPGPQTRRSRRHGWFSVSSRPPGTSEAGHGPGRGCPSPWCTMDGLPTGSTPRAPVAQGIEHRFPKPCAKVRILPGAPNGLDPVSGTPGFSEPGFGPSGQSRRLPVTRPLIDHSSISACSCLDEVGKRSGELLLRRLREACEKSRGEDRPGGHRSSRAPRDRLMTRTERRNGDRIRDAVE